MKLQCERNCQAVVLAVFVATLLSIGTNPVAAQEILAGEAASLVMPAGTPDSARAAESISDRDWAAESGWIGATAREVCLCDACQAASAGGNSAKGRPGFATCCHGLCVDWSKVPVVRPMPRTGNFGMPVAGPGYYSAFDWVTGTWRDKPPKSGYPSFTLMPPSFFDADFRYVDGLDPAERTLVEGLKRIHGTDCWTFGTGGQFWARYMNENNSRLTETNNDYTLSRVRVYGDAMYGDTARVFGEFLWADSLSPDLAPLPTDVNRGDIQNLFVDLKLFELDEHAVILRGGRQELLFGSQRLVSALDWANTRRTFQGARLFRRGDKWDADLFWVQPVLPSADHFDSPDEKQNLAGGWLTYRPEAGRFLDFYYLYYGNGNSVAQQQIVRAPLDLHTFGSRWTGDKEGWLWDAELAMQLGEQNAADVLAGMATVGVGRHLPDVWANPTAWIYYDYASGDAQPNAGDCNTFNQLSPFGHYYLGWIDLVGRQNVHDLNAHVYLYAAPWITTFVQYHHFWLNQATDALYNAAGNAYRRDPTGAAGTNVGDEIDVVANFHLARYSDLLVGYSQLFGGRFLEQTAGPGRAANAEQFFVSFSQRW